MQQKRQWMSSCLKGISLLLASLLFQHVHARGVTTYTTLRYAYDNLNRLVSVSRSDGPSFTYQYDEVGNIVEKRVESPDSDGDQIRDIVEIGYGLDPNKRDTDSDGLDDYTEVCFDGDCNHYNPFDPVTNPAGTDLDAARTDTDGDGIADNEELLAGTNPIDAADFPVIADGDLNIDGIVDAVDVLLAIRIAQGQIVPDITQMKHGDVAPLVNGVPQPDGRIDAGDILIIQRKALGKINF